MILAAALSVLIGLVLGMLGGGGAILALPMLVYAVHVEPKTAIAMSLFVVGATSVVGAAVHARAGTVRWKLGATFGAAAMTGAFAGGRLAAFIPAAVLLVLFAGVMLVTATAMLRPPSPAAAEPRTLALGRALVLGAAVGVLSGLVGAGGGFLIVPALTVFGGLSMREAIGTSLLVIALQSFAGFAGHIAHVELDWMLVAVVTGGAVAGTLVGAFAGKRVSPDNLRRGFAWLVIAMGLLLLGQQVPLAVTVGVAVVVAIALFFVTRTKPRTPGTKPCTISPHSPH
jgi:uncharacterized protein